MSSDSTQACPKCGDIGDSWVTCSRCSGSGYITDTDSFCPRCLGDGQIPPDTPCSLCQNQGVVTTALARLYDADSWIRKNNPQWNGDDQTCSGVTLHSQAKWFRMRAAWHTRIVGANGMGDFVVLYATRPASAEKHHQISLTFHGFAWGYGGEGPNGLADVLADCGFFDDRIDALRWVASQPKDAPWTLSRDARPSRC